MEVKFGGFLTVVGFFYAGVDNTHDSPGRDKRDKENYLKLILTFFASLGPA